MPSIRYVACPPAGEATGIRQRALPIWVLAALLATLVGCGAVPPPATQVAQGPVSPPETPAFATSSNAFGSGGTIPVPHSCHADNLSPPLTWTGVPAGTQALALLVDDPDSKTPGFVHWVIYNIPASATGLGEGVPGGAELADGSLQGSNDCAPYGPGTFAGGAEKKLVGYDGPCPPGGEHRYVFTLYAVDAPLDLRGEATVDEVVAAMEGHVLGQAELIGLLGPP